MGCIKRFLTSEDGPTAVEYAVIIALILITMFASVGAIGGGTANWFLNANTEMQTYGL